MRISLDALQILDAIDARGSFAAAASALHRVPSALTHAVRKLEDGLAVTLFVRQGRRAVVIADTSRQLLARSAGLLRGQDTLVVPDMAAKLAAQVAGLGVGHPPLPLAAPEIAAGRLVAKRTVEAGPGMPLAIAWRSDHEGRALEWFLKRLEDASLRAALLGAPAGKRVTRAGRSPSR